MNPQRNCLRPVVVGISDNVFLPGNLQSGTEMSEEVDSADYIIYYGTLLIIKVILKFGLFISGHKI
jgi:hypothetical protein